MGLMEKRLFGVGFKKSPLVFSKRKNKMVPSYYKIYFNKPNTKSYHGMVLNKCVRAYKNFKFQVFYVPVGEGLFQVSFCQSDKLQNGT